jgi:hypothetical protein
VALDEVVRSVLLGLAGIAFLLIESKIAVVGPCTNTFGVFCHITFLLCLPAGGVLLLIVRIRYLLRRTKHAEAST